MGKPASRKARSEAWDAILALSRADETVTAREMPEAPSRVLDPSVPRGGVKKGRQSKFEPQLLPQAQSGLIRATVGRSAPTMRCIKARPGAMIWSRSMSSCTGTTFRLLAQLVASPVTKFQCCLLHLVPPVPLVASETIERSHIVRGRGKHDLALWRGWGEK